MKYILLAITCLLLLSCFKTEKKELPFDSFVYSFSAQHLDYSVKFTENDTVYFQKRHPSPLTNYFSIMKSYQKDSLIALINKLEYSKYDTIYNQDNIVDAEGFKFYTVKNGKENSIYVYGSKAPKELYEYAEKLNNFTKQFDFKPYNKSVDFGNLKNIELPTPPPIDSLK